MSSAAYMVDSLLILLFFFCLSLPLQCQSRKPISTLRIVPHHDTVRIVQFSDLHLSSHDFSDTLALMRAVLWHERPDFVVFSGDRIVGYEASTVELRLVLWELAVTPAAELQIPFATIFGNHDDLPYKTDSVLWSQLACHMIACLYAVYGVLFCFAGRTRTLVYGAALMSVLAMLLLLIMIAMPSNNVRKVLVEHERRIFPLLSYTGIGPSDIHGVSNYRVVLEAPTFSIPLYFLDSGGGMIDEAISPGQLGWLRRHGHSHGGLSFMHVSPLRHKSGGCSNPLHRKGSSKILLGTLRQMGVEALFVGHNHESSLCCESDSVMLCYGKQSGFDSSTGRVRGARVIDVRSNGTLEDTRVVLWDRQAGVIISTESTSL